MFNLKTAALGALVAIAFAGGAQATDLTVTVRANEYGAHRFVDNDEEGGSDRFSRHGRAEQREPFDQREEWRDRRRAGGWGMGYPAFAGRGWGRHHEDCRIIVKRRVDPWGDVTVRRIRICG